MGAGMDAGGSAGQNLLQLPTPLYNVEEEHRGS